MLDVPVPVGTACVVILVTRGKSSEADVEDEELETTLSPEIDVWVDTPEPVLVLVIDPIGPMLLELLELELLELELLRLAVLEIEVEKGVELARDFAG